MGQRKQLLLSIVVLCFMLFGAIPGIFEEAIILVPVMIALVSIGAFFIEFLSGITLPLVGLLLLIGGLSG